MAGWEVVSIGWVAAVVSSKVEETAAIVSETIVPLVRIVPLATITRKRREEDIGIDYDKLGTRVTTH